MWRVMIADDEPYIREGLEKLIPWEELGCELIYVAENGQDLLEQIRSCPPDIAIIDIKMPLMDGMEVAEYIYKNHIRTSVIFLTAYASHLPPPALCSSSALPHQIRLRHL